MKPVQGSLARQANFWWRSSAASLIEASFGAGAAILAWQMCESRGLAQLSAKGQGLWLCPRLAERAGGIPAWLAVPGPPGLGSPPADPAASQPCWGQAGDFGCCFRRARGPRQSPARLSCPGWVRPPRFSLGVVGSWASWVLRRADIWSAHKGPS